MKALIILTMLFTLGIVFYKYSKDKNLKKLLITLATFSYLVSLSIVGNLTRPVIPIFLAHNILIIIAWGALLFMYVFKQKYCWWWFVMPLLTIGLFLGLEYVGGSAHELG